MPGGAATTRTAVVEAFLDRWRQLGLTSVTEFGRPRELNEAQQYILMEELKAGRLKSLKEAAAFLKNKFGLKFDVRSVRSYCRRCGFNLPARLKHPRVKLHHSWNEANIVNCSGGNHKLRKRLMAILRACSETSLPLRRIAGGDNNQSSPESTLRMDLKTIKTGTTLEEFTARCLRIPLLERAHLQHIFYSWADERYRITGKAPSAREAVEFLRAEHGVEIKIKTLYIYLAEWKWRAKIGTQKHRTREKFVPSDGISAISIP